MLKLWSRRVSGQVGCSIADGIGFCYSNCGFRRLDDVIVCFFGMLMEWSLRRFSDPGQLHDQCARDHISSDNRSGDIVAEVIFIGEMLQVRSAYGIMARR